MAERRMFAKTIIDSDAFLDMPQSTQLLYFHLSMRADDEGFINNAKSIMRNTGCKEDDIKLLIAKRFIIPFESGVIVIKHWKIHNYIQKDRFTPSKYIEEKNSLFINEKGAYSLEKREVAINRQPLSPARLKRLEARRESELPDSFDYKIRNAFIGERCPICKILMGVPVRDETGIIISTPMPSVQHNIPISKGGKHELSNISVVCRSCNASVQDNPTGKLNNDLVVAKWEFIIGNVSGMDTQVRLGKDSIGKDSVEESICGSDEPAPTPKIKKQKYGEYKNVLLTDEEHAKIIAEPNGIEAIEFLSAYIAEKTYKSKSHYLAIKRWVLNAVGERAGKGETKSILDPLMRAAQKEMERCNGKN